MGGFLAALGHCISAAEGQLWGAHGQMRKCRERQYWKRMTCGRRVWEVAELGACPSSSSPEVLKAQRKRMARGPDLGSNPGSGTYLLWTSGNSLHLSEPVSSFVRWG